MRISGGRRDAWDGEVIGSDPRREDQCAGRMVAVESASFSRKKADLTLKSSSSMSERDVVD